MGFNEDTSSIEVEFVKEKDTKNAVRFAEVLAPGQDRGVVGTLYVLKSDLGNIGNPEKIRVTIEAVS